MYSMLESGGMSAMSRCFRYDYIFIRMICPVETTVAAF